MARGALVVDLETYSPVDIKKWGAAVYAEHPETRVLCGAFGWLEPGAPDPSLLSLWWAGEELPEWVADALADPDVPLVAHNAAFERLVLYHHRPPEWPDADLNLSRWHCTQAMCAHRALPLALEEAAIALGQAEKKDPAGKRLIKRCCTPQAKPPTEDELSRLGAYCLQDVRAECQLAHAIGWELPASEREVWLVDQIANDRGLPLDVDLARAIDGIADAIDEASSARLTELTSGAVTSLSQNKRLAEWAGLPSVSKATLATLDQELSPEVAEALTLRPRTSLRKARNALGAACRDGRVRHTQQYHAATTGRWGGRLVQPHNFARPIVKAPAFDTLVSAPPGLLAMAFGWRWVEEHAVSALRGMIAAAPGETLTRADLSAIEARVVLWLAGEWDAIQKYRDGVDLYCDFASVLHGRTIVKGDPERQHGKIGILGCGFQAGDKRLYDQAMQDNVPGVTRDLIKTLVETYRSRYARVKRMWYALNDAAIASIYSGGEWVEAGDDDFRLTVPIAFRVAKGPAGHVWMQCRLPSGRLLHYFDPILATNKFGKTCVQWRAMKPAKNGGRSWSVVAGYGGLFTENVVQAIARDIIARAFVRLEREGYRPIFLVHDEVVCEGTLTAPELEAILSAPVDWAPGLPIAAEGVQTRRFGK